MKTKTTESAESDEKDPKKGLSKKDRFKAMLLKKKGKGEKAEESDRSARARALVDTLLENEDDEPETDDDEPEGDEPEGDDEPEGEEEEGDDAK